MGSRLMGEGKALSVKLAFREGTQREGSFDGSQCSQRSLLHCGCKVSSHNQEVWTPTWEELLSLLGREERCWACTSLPSTLAQCPPSPLPSPLITCTPLFWVCTNGFRSAGLGGDMTQVPGYMGLHPLLADDEITQLVKVMQYTSMTNQPGHQCVRF